MIRPTWLVSPYQLRRRGESRKRVIITYTCWVIYVANVTWVYIRWVERSGQLDSFPGPCGSYEASPVVRVWPATQLLTIEIYSCWSIKVAWNSSGVFSIVPVLIIRLPHHIKIQRRDPLLLSEQNLSSSEWQYHTYSDLRVILDT